MIFQVVLIKDLEVKHRIESTGWKTKDEIILLPCGTVLDVYGIYGDTQTQSSYSTEYTFPRFIFYHKSLPCFYDCAVGLCRPAI